VSFFRRLFGRRPDLAPIAEEEAYARSYGDRGGDLIRVSRIVIPPKPARAPVQPPPRAQERGDLTGELLRRAFETRLDRRAHSPHR
jgi:hypothetical protein